LRRYAGSAYIDFAGCGEWFHGPAGNKPMIVPFVQHNIYTDAAKAAAVASNIDLDEGETIHVVPDAAGVKFIIEVRYLGEHVVYI
jgi:hypothetical protein